MSDWPGWAGLGVAVASSIGTAYVGYREKRARRVATIDDVLRDHEDKVLFDQRTPDEDLRRLQKSAAAWREKCSLAKMAVRRGSSEHRDLDACRLAAASFENQVEAMLRNYDAAEYVYVRAEDAPRLEKLRAELRAATAGPIEDLATKRGWRRSRG